MYFTPLKNGNKRLWEQSLTLNNDWTWRDSLFIHSCDCFALQVDDGFWEGELNGQIGVFPSLVVELVHNEAEEEEEEEEEKVKLYVQFLEWSCARLGRLPNSSYC